MCWIFKNRADDAYRYVLGTEGSKTLFCVGVNPSTAKPGCLDATMRKVKSISEYNGFDSFIMLNLYPQRSSDFEGLSKCEERDESLENLRQIEDVISDRKKIVVWLAFGDLIYGRKYLAGCFKDIYGTMAKTEVKWLAAGVNKSGAPKHPLYQKNDTVLVPFDAKEYIKTLN